MQTYAKLIFSKIPDTIYFSFITLRGSTETIIELLGLCHRLCLSDWPIDFSLARKITVANSFSYRLHLLLTGLICSVWENTQMEEESLNVLRLLTTLTRLALLVGDAELLGITAALSLFPAPLHQGRCYGLICKWQAALTHNYLYTLFTFSPYWRLRLPGIKSWRHVIASRISKGAILVIRELWNAKLARVSRHSLISSNLQFSL
ncbi:unnamed protein product [Protopolystoma xenopodis]|uniref:Uncharacterized protein n=1 Tax=Protopolystoma xenopodis TaxID=117903 RepID=A0A448XP93_9PLAT|nr:unnamed protein product [Protopolystoma xenopodis]